MENGGKGGLVATAVLVIATAAGTYSSFLPSWFTISSTFFNEQGSRDGNVKRIRQGEIAATAFTLVEGGAASYLVKSPIPLIAAAAVGVVMVAGYEYALAHPATEETEYGSSPLPSALTWRKG